MSNTNKAPKQWCLSKTETVNSLENGNITYFTRYPLALVLHRIYHMTLNVRRSQKPTQIEIPRTTTNDQVPERKRQTVQQKPNSLDLMLGQIENYCPVISHNVIVNSSSLEQIWQILRLHFGFNHLVRIF